jgi:hypothetical protein
MYFDIGAHLKEKRRDDSVIKDQFSLESRTLLTSDELLPLVITYLKQPSSIYWGIPFSFDI